MKNTSGQTAIEYLLLLAAVVAVTLIALNSNMGGMQEAGNIYFERTSEGLLGKPSPCGDGLCTEFEKTADKCMLDCG